MNVLKLTVVALAVAAVTMFASCGDGGNTTTKAAVPTGKTLKIAVIPKGTTHAYWKSINAGAVKAERELRAAATAPALTTRARNSFHRVWIKFFIQFLRIL